MSAVACQQISLPLGIRLLNRLAEAYGIAVSRRHASRHAFPRPETLAQLKPVDLRTLGFSMQKARTVIGLSAPWRPYAGMIYFHLLLRKLHAQSDMN